MVVEAHPKINRTLESVQPGERWVKTVCNGCIANTCGMRVLVRNGMIIKAVGDAENPLNQGALCSKAHAFVFGFHNPNRIKRPMKRTNPEKGPGIDPKWVEISYEEAYETIARKLKEQRERDPYRTIIRFGDFITNQWNGSIVGNAWGDMVRPTVQGCGHAVHSQTHMKWASFLVNPDLPYTKYMILMGSQKGANVQHYPVTAAVERANAQQRGMKIVAVDPLATNSTSKAHEWLPIRPGTDGALALAWMNILVNELRIFDAEFLRTYTNCPYLVAEDGRYLRDPATNKPLLWDEATGSAKAYSDPQLEKPALEGSYTVRLPDGRAVKVKTAFEVFKEEVRSWTPERASEVTTAPVEAIRRIAKEYGEAANIGGTIVIDGEVLPYRPAAVHWHRGVSSHANAYNTGRIIALLNILVGNVDMPGGMLGTAIYMEPPGIKERSLINGDRSGYTDIGDGIMGPSGGPTLSRMGIHKVTWFKPELDSEGRAVGSSHGGLFPASGGLGRGVPPGDMLHPERHGKLLNNPLPETIILGFSSSMLTSNMDPQEMIKMFKQAKFVACQTSIVDEAAEFADVIIPSAHFLERLEPFCNPETNFSTGFHNDGEYYCWNMRAPVIETDIPHHWDVWFELCDRLGLLSDLNETLNNSMDLRGEYRLEREKKYTWRQLMDRWTQQRLGRSLQDVLQEGKGHIKWKKNAKERYPRAYFKNARIPFYAEEMVDAKEALEKMLQEMRIDWWDLREYTPIPRWYPCKAWEPNRDRTEFDLVTVSYKVPFIQAQFSLSQPWIAELANLHPYAWKVWINAETAQRKGLADDDWVKVESQRNGRTVEAQVKLSECVHPDVIGIVSHGGHWSKPFGESRGKGLFVDLLYHSHEYMDYMLGHADHCVAVKLTKTAPPTNA